MPRAIPEERIREAQPLIDELVKRISSDAVEEFEIGRLAYMIYATGIPWRKLAEFLKARGVSSVSYSWVYRMAVVYDWWVVKGNYSPEHLANVSKNKLYYMASKKLHDIALLQELNHLSDSQFITEIRRRLGIEPNAVVFSLPTAIKRRMEEWATKLAGVIGQPVSVVGALEFGLEVLMQLPDRTTKLLWNAVHGEIDEEDYYEEEEAQDN